MKKLYRSRQNRMIAGVCGGIAEYFNIDPTVVRLLYLVISFFTAFFVGGIIFYILAAIVIPQ
ncbi:MAG: PspC domain-containing protein [Firmicutes bacterium]|nr:PspC domain-containing protein [Bacillota bacterium]MDD4263705.1 PspC domain-containing protein [Bacillota bacterium]MDD4693867.1 PspC domain-containing protein [Bacillota bacterium]